MKKINIWTDINIPLEFHEDNRGKIADVFYNKKKNPKQKE